MEPTPATVLAPSPRRRTKGADRRRQVVEATLDVLAAKGYAELTIGDIARSLGISTALILQHFKTKDALLLEAQRLLAAEYHDNWQRALAASGPSAAEKLWSLVTAEFAEAIFAETGVNCRVVEITTEKLRRPAARPAYSVMRSERDRAPRLPHWREGLRACLERLAATE